MQTAREVALNALYKIDVGEGYSNLILDKELNKSELTRLDRALASEIVYGVLTWKLFLDETIKRYSLVKFKKISPWIVNILRMGIYQIVFLNKIPESAAVNESVNLAKKYGHDASARFTNAILRKVEKDEREKLIDYLQKNDFLNDEIISITTSHPRWMVDKLLDDYDSRFVLELLEANNENPDTTIRVNTLKTSREELRNLFDLKDIDSRSGELPDALIVKHLTNFDDPLYVVQDEAAQLAVLKLDPKENEIVLDACSSPGGKTTYISQLMNNTGRIDAWDIHEHRVELVKQLAKKLGATNINASVADATEYHTELRDRYDKVLLDVPCSGLGVIRKKPDIKWTRKEEDLPELIDTQRKILECGAEYLKTGGTLVYSTCTVLKDENERQIEKFLKKHPEFKLEEEIKLFPHKNHTDGFYIAKMIKI
ncbi:MAG: 16S rRNA (cytosine(967)-C(5))-methyltransferase RsmB [Clostridia bacterium]|nr:16S rRNA (cytosine(967)-C(5))-methyltransferase RsmB [Clostridia bacterium]